MFCPRCGQQQATDSMRFCSRCGFAMEGVMHLLGHNGMLPHYPTEPGETTISPRRKGVKQGGMLLLSGAVIVPLVAVMESFSNSTFLEVLAAFAAIICFIGGPLRMLYAAVFEEPAPKPVLSYAPPPIGASPRPQFAPHPQHQALPPPPARPTGAWRPRPNTAELAGPPSVTENTTRLLEKEDRGDH